ncbi:MAG: hypothetical protein F4Z50_05850 [Gemmatimonadetes bacterium]|nr:hypothetical protein [Gemmatimonadota bacterium]
MIFLAPVFLAAAGIVAAGVVALHFLSTREPDTDLLPTVRFVPRVPVQATTITTRFTDPWLLALRVLLILLLGTALARPLIHPFAQPVSRIALVDVSRAVGSPGELADSADGYVDGAAAVVFFDDEAKEIEDESADALEDLRDDARWDRASRGSLSTALIAALRIASRLRDGADSLQLVVISPFAQEERDAATGEIRALWPGRIDAVRVAAAPPQPDAEATVERVEWADSGATGLWTQRETPDTIGGVRASDAVMVYPFVRRWQPAADVPESEDGAGAADSTESADARETRVYARWIDGEPAAFERATADGCMRSVAIPLPTEGDAILRPDFQRFLDELEGPCGEPRDLAPLPDEFMAAFVGDEPLAPASLVPRRVMRTTPAVPWLLGFALVVAFAELWLRRQLATGARANRADEGLRESRAA